MPTDQDISTDAPATDASFDDQLQAFLGRFVGDLGAAMHATLIVVGDKLGLYKALADGPATSAELAERTGCAERYLREWLAAQAASGYAHYDAETGRYWLDDVQVFALADETSPAFIPGGFYLAVSTAKDLEKFEDVFRTGAGVGWHEHDHHLFHGCERFFRPGYQANLVSSWIPALDGVHDKLVAGATVADVGCGHGASTIILAEAYPASRFVGYDYHPASIEQARKAAAEVGVSDRVSFQVASASDFPSVDGGYDLVAFFDCLHDMGDPVGAARHVKETLAPDGTWLLVEPYANDRVEDNLNPVGRVYYSASTVICTAHSLSQEVGLALGAQAGEARLRQVVEDGGFTRFRRATETPFNLVLEAKP
jgi:SAM-dependent methyltransferase